MKPAGISAGALVTVLDMRRVRDSFEFARAHLPSSVLAIQCDMVHVYCMEHGASITAHYSVLRNTTWNIVTPLQTRPRFL